MRVVALVSGGKDSCYSMQLCKQHGHDVVALANLLPGESAPDELDSFCFQTVGHQLIGAYAACMGIPLFRKHISGTSSVQDLGYSPTEGDEVEDLYQLLAYVKENIPGVQAVASGAIASDYQRLRVENVCSRLNLVSLAYLWHQPQRMLLRGMVDSGVEAILVKVACLGLHPRKHLGRTIAAMEPTLLALADAYGCNVCGEGGEYETLTLDCAVFSRGSIQLDEFEIVLGSSDVGHLVPKAFRVLPKAGWEGCELPSDVRLVPGDYVAAPSRSPFSRSSAPPLPLQPAAPANAPLPASPGLGGGNTIAAAAGGPAAAAAAAALSSASSSSSCGSVSSSVSSSVDALLQPCPPSSFSVQVSVCSGPDYVQLVCRAVRPRSALPSDLTECDTTAALHALLTTAEQELAAQHMDLHHCLFVHLFLANMGHFQAANGVYCRHFPGRDPPSRACVQVCLPHDCPVMCELLLARGAAPPLVSPAAPRSPLPLSAAGAGAGLPPPPLPPLPPPSPVSRHSRKVLHVQSISSWAPSCIGPYSQATSYRGLVYLAGVIPLDPPLMTLVPGDITAQVLRAMLSCEAVAVAQRTTVVGAALGLTVYLAAAVGGGGGGGGGGGLASGGGSGGGPQGCGCSVERSVASGSSGGTELRALTRSAVEALLEHGLPGYPHSQHRGCGPPSAGTATAPGCGPGGAGGGGGARYHRSSTCDSTSSAGLATPRGSQSQTHSHGTWPGVYSRASAPGSRRAVLLGADGLDEEEEEAAAAEQAAAASGLMFGGRAMVGGQVVYGGPASAAALLDSYLQPPEVRVSVRPSVLYVSVPSLPRGSLVEIQPVCLDVEALAVIRKLTGHDSFVKRRNSSHHDAASLHAAANHHHNPNHANANPSHSQHAAALQAASAASGQPPGIHGGAFISPTGATMATSWSELPPTPRASMESLVSGREYGAGAGAAGSGGVSSGAGGIGGGGSSLNLMHLTQPHHHGSSPVQWQVSADMMGLGLGGMGGGMMGLGFLGAMGMASPLPSHVLSAAGFMSPDAGGSLAGTPSAGLPMLSRQRSSGMVAAGLVAAANGSSSGGGGGGLAGISSLGGGGGGAGGTSFFHRSLSPGPQPLVLPGTAAPAGMVVGALPPTAPPPVSGMTPWAQIPSAPPAAAQAAAGAAAGGGEGQAPSGLQTPPHPPLSAQSSGRQLLSPTLQHLLQLQPSPQLLLQPLQQATANAPPLQQLQQLQQQQQQQSQLHRAGTGGVGAGGGGGGGGRLQRLSGSNGGAVPAGMARERSSFSGGSSGSSSGPLAQRSSLDGNILSFEVSSGRGGPPVMVPPPHSHGFAPPSHGAAAAAAAPAEAAEALPPAAAAAPAVSPPNGSEGGRVHAAVARPRPAAISVPPPSVGGGGGTGSAGVAPAVVTRSPFEAAVSTAAGAAAAGISAAAEMAPVASPHPPHPPALTIPHQASSSGSETTSTPVGHASGPAASEVVAPPVAAAATVRPGAAAGSGSSSSSDVMVTTVCCYGQVLRSLFHLPPAVFAPDVTTAQLTRRFRRAAASVLAAHGMDMSCLIWARVWYEKGTVEFTDDEYGTGATAAGPAVTSAAAAAAASAGSGGQSYPSAAGAYFAGNAAMVGGPRVLHALEDDADVAGGAAGGGSGHRRRSVRRISGSGDSSGGGSGGAGPATGATAAAAPFSSAAVAAVAPATALGSGGCGSPRPSAAAHGHRPRPGPGPAAAAASLGSGAGSGVGSPRCPGSPAGAVASPSAHHRRLSGLQQQQPDVPPFPSASRDDQQVHHHHNGGHGHSFTHHHHQHQHHQHTAKDAAALNGAQPPPAASAAAQQHFHVSWVPVQRVATNATPQPARCVAVLELLAALPSP